MDLQQQIQHRDLHMNSGDTIQIEVLDFDRDIDDISPTTIDQTPNNPLTQGSVSPIPKTAEQETKHITPAPSHQYRLPRNRLARCHSSRDSITGRPAKSSKNKHSTNMM